MLLLKFSEPLKHSLCCEALSGAWEALHPFPPFLWLFRHFVGPGWALGASCWLTVGRGRIFLWHVLASFQTPWEFPSHSLLVLLAALGSKHGKLALPWSFYCHSGQKLPGRTCPPSDVHPQLPGLLLLSGSLCAFSEVDKLLGKVLAVSQVWLSRADL